MRICVNCHKKITTKEHYFEVIERKNKKVLSVKYAHKTCQDDYDKKIKESQITPEMKENLNSALEKANDLLTKLGGEEIVYIK